MTYKRKKRYLNKFYNTEDFYKDYRANKSSRFKRQNKKIYKQVLFDYNKAVADLIIDKGLEFHFGLLGVMRIAKIKTHYKKPRIDYNHFNKTGQIIPHMNFHSDGYIAKFFWVRSCRVTNDKYYSFVPCNTIGKRIGKIMKEHRGHNKYPLWYIN